MTEEKANSLSKKIGTIGHIDHGKTTLTVAIEATTPDRERGIVIVDSISEKERIEELTKKFPDAQILTPEEALVLMKNKEVSQNLKVLRELEKQAIELKAMPRLEGFYSDGKANRRAKRKNKAKGSDIYNLLKKKH